MPNAFRKRSNSPRKHRSPLIGNQSKQEDCCLFCVEVYGETKCRDPFNHDQLPGNTPAERRQKSFLGASEDDELHLTTMNNEDNDEQVYQMEDENDDETYGTHHTQQTYSIIDGGASQK